MFEQLRFYLRHSINDLRVNGQRTIFALLCIAAGVAAIVSLQTLGVMIDDSLTTSLQESNGGDLKLLPVDPQDSSPEDTQQGREAGVLEDATGAGTFGGHADADGNTYFSAAGVAEIEAWFTAQYPGTELTYRQTIAGGHGPMSMASISNLRTDEEQMFVAPYFVDATAYPLYGDRLDEDGVPLDERLQAPTDIVISRKLADTISAEVGDTLRINGASDDFTLRGIVPTDVESGFENIGSTLFGLFYLDRSATALFDADELGIDRVFVKLPDPAQVETVGNAFSDAYPYLALTTTVDLEEENSEIADNLNQLTTIMGLVSLLIGGIGIVNTMQVVVSRRTTEIAVLKTVGLEGGQVTLLFLTQAVLMGLIGSVFGVVLGWAGAYAIKGIAGTFLAQSLTFRLTLAPALNGIVVGVLVTTVFGFLPTLAAGQVRPSLVLRPSETVMPRTGRLRSLAALVVVMAALSLVAQPLIGGLLDDLRLIGGGAATLLGLILGALVGWEALRDWRWTIALVVGGATGFAFGYAVPAVLILSGAFIVVGVLYAVLWNLIWLVGRFFPALGLVDMKVALRSMVSSRGRGASTLLALVIGVFALSLITMLTSAISNRFESLLVDEMGGNVVIFASGQAGTLETIEARLDEIEGVNSYAAIGAYNVELVGLEDVSAGETIPMSELQARVDAEVDAPEAGPGHHMSDLTTNLSAIDARGVDSNLPEVDFYAGRQLNAGDADQPHIIVPANDATLAAGFEVGDWLIFRLIGVEGAPEIRLEIVGMVDRTGSAINIGATSASYAPEGAFPAGTAPDSVSAVVDVDEDQIGAVRTTMNAVPGVFVMETRYLNDLVNRMITQFTSFPMLVASLALVVGGIVIANSVALSTLERRREIGIMKAIGMQRERVLNMLLLENGLMGLIGGLLGVGISSVILLVLLIGMFGGNLGNSVPYLTALALMGLCVAIALAAAALTVWGASGEKPLNVLRYE